MKHEKKPNSPRPTSSQIQSGANIEITNAEEKIMKPDVSKLVMGLPLCLSILQLLSALPVQAQPNVKQDARANIVINPEASKDPRALSMADMKKRLLLKELKSTNQDFSGSIDSSSSINSVAGGNSGTGGGDIACEKRIQDIRDDISSWIINGGHKGLKNLSISADEYAHRMQDYLAVEKKDNGNIWARTNINCVHHPIEVQGNEKTCRFDQLPEGPKITCNVTDFLNKKIMTEDNQYQLIHHEFAGLAGLENPYGPQSNYEYSKQISKFLEFKKVKMLVVKTANIGELDAQNNRFHQLLEYFDKGDKVTEKEMSAFSGYYAGSCFLASDNKPYEKMLRIEDNSFVPNAGPAFAENKVYKYKVGLIYTILNSSIKNEEQAKLKYEEQANAQSMSDMEWYNEGNAYWIPSVDTYEYSASFIKKYNDWLVVKETTVDSPSGKSYAVGACYFYKKF